MLFILKSAMSVVAVTTAGERGRRGTGTQNLLLVTLGRLLGVAAAENTAILT